MIWKSGLAIALALSASGAALAEASAPVSGEQTQAGPYSPDSDPLFAQPYTDVDEWRDGPVRHRYVHGGFRGTNTRFSFYLPPPELYRGRFFQHITPVPDNENLAQKMPPGPFNKIAAAIAGGAYFVETNGGGQIDLTQGSLALADPTITAYRANAAAAAYSRKVAMEMYGAKRPYGYAYGGSGGGFRTIGGIENTHGVWDGVVPYVIGSTMAIPNMFTVRMQALRVLRDRMPAIVDAMEPGGSGDPYAGLSEYEASVLREIETMGFPMQSWFGWRTMGLHGFAALYGGVAMADPTYFTDFWSKPGYLGHDRPELFEKDRIRFSTRVGEPITAEQAARLGLSADPFAPANRGGVDTAYKGPPGEANRIVGFRLAHMPPQVYFLGGELVVGSGAGAGRKLMLSTLKGDVVMLGVADPKLAASIAAGDEVTVDNSNFLAMETYHRHQVPGPDFPVWDQFRKADGTPKFPQRPTLLGPRFVESTSGSRMTGRFEGRMIVVASLWDREAMPWQADWYRQRVAKNLGAETDNRFRLWFTQHALHGDEPTTEAASRVVSYVPALNRALRDLADWVENGKAPPASTGYRVAEGQILVAPNATARAGVQPVVSLSVNGARRVEVKAGQSVTFKGRISAPPGAGSLVGADWDLDGTGRFAASSRIRPGAKQSSVTIRHRFERPGTWFVGLRGSVQRDDEAGQPYTRIDNIDRVRVVVRP